jgi:hypothetical protein
MTPELGGKTPALGGRTPAFGGTVPGTNGAFGLSGLKRGWPFGKKPCAPLVIPCRATFPAGFVNAAAAGFVKNRLLFVPVKILVRPKFVGAAGEKRGRSENGACAIALAPTRKLKNVSGVFITQLEHWLYRCGFAQQPANEITKFAARCNEHGTTTGTLQRKSGVTSHRFAKNLSLSVISAAELCSLVEL